MSVPRLRHVLVVSTTALAAAWGVVFGGLALRGVPAGGYTRPVVLLLVWLAALLVAVALTCELEYVFAGRRWIVISAVMTMVGTTIVALGGRHTTWPVRALALPAGAMALTLLGLGWAQMRKGIDRRAARELQAGIGALGMILAGISGGATAAFGAHGQPPLDGITGRQRILVVVASSVVAVVFAAWHWSRRWFLGTTLLTAVLMVAILVPEGARREIGEQRPEARSAATALLAEVRTMDVRIADAETAAVERAETTRTEAAETLGVTVDDDGPEPIPTCAPEIEATPAGPGEPSVDAVLCDALRAVFSANQRRGMQADGTLDPDGDDRGADVSDVPDDAATAVDRLLADDDLAPGQAGDVRRLADAIDAAEGAWVRPASRAASTAAGTEIELLCTRAGGVVSSTEARPPDGNEVALPVETCAAGASNKLATSSRLLELDEASARQAVAAAAVVVAPTEATKATLARADEVWAEATRDLEESDPQSVVDLVGDAGDDLVEGLRLTGDDAVPAAFTPFVWALVAVAALAALRWLARVNVDRGAVTLEIGEVQCKGKDADGEMTAIFRRHVLSNAKEPATLPGASRSLGVTDILSKTDWSGELLEAVMALLERVFAATASHTVLSTYLEIDDPTVEDGQRHEMFVQLRSHRTGEVVARGSVRAGSKALVAREAGYWVAARVLTIDRTTPGWAAWSDAASEALSMADAVRGQGEQARREHLAALRTAAAKAPTSGIVLTRLANALDEADETIDALEIELRAVQSHPRYPVARYRLIASLSMAADKVHDDMLRRSHVQWRRIDASLEHLRTVTGYTGKGHIIEKGELRPAMDVKQALLGLALDLEGSAALVGWPEHCLVLALRRRERAYWIGYALRIDGWRTGAARQALVRSIDRAVLARKGSLLREGAQSETGTKQRGLSSEERRRLVLDRDDSMRWGQVAYTDACTLAIAAAGGVRVEGVEDGSGTVTPDRYPDAAVELLERARELDAAGTITAGWVAVDPDLDPLRSMARFQQLANQLPHAEGSHRGDAS